MGKLKEPLTSITWTQKKNKTLELHKQGMPYKEIAEAVKVSSPCVRNWLLKEGLDPICIIAKNSKVYRDKAVGKFAHLK